MPLKASEQVAQTTDNKEIRSLLMREYMKKLRTLDDNIGCVYHFLMSHCHPTLQTRMRLEQSFIALAGDENTAELWTIISRICNDNNVGLKKVQGGRGTRKKTQGFACKRYY